MKHISNHLTNKIQSNTTLNQQNINPTIPIQHSNNTNTTPILIKLKKSQRYLHPDKLTIKSQKFSHFLTAKHIITGNYQSFISQFTNNTNKAVPHHSQDITNPYTEQSKAVLETILNQYTLNHAELNSNQQHSTFFAIQTILYNINSALLQIEADQYKTGGAAVRRLSKSIKQYKTARSNYNLLLSSIRQAISSTVRTRQHLQNTTDDQIKFIYNKAGELKSYESKIWSADYNAITTVLNSDLYYLYQDYKLTLKYLTKINRSIEQYNLLLSNIDQNTLRRSLQLSNN